MNQTDALVHGDLHTGSIMINQTDTFVIDSEFAFFGPMGFDIGAVLANLILAWVSHFERSKNADYQRWLLNATLEVYQRFETKFLDLWNKHASKENAMVLNGFCTQELLKAYQQVYLLQVLRDSVGFAGLKMARRILGIAGVADIRNIEEGPARARAEKFALAISRRLVIESEKIDNITDVLLILKQEQTHYEQRR